MRPYVIATQQTAFHEKCPLPDVQFHDVMDPSSLRFYRLANAANRIAFGGIAMPAWVQLDFCAVPSALIGFAERRDQFPTELWERISTAYRETFPGQPSVQDYEGWVPLSGYCAMFTREIGTVAGVSLYSLVTGLRLGVKTKALALACYGATRQIGLTQYGNRAVRTHTAFGDLQVLSARAPAHDYGLDTFQYVLDLPDREALSLLANGGVLPVVEGAIEKMEIVPGKTHEALAARLEEGRSVHIAAPGWEERDGVKWLQLRAD